MASTPPPQADKPPALACGVRPADLDGDAGQPSPSHGAPAACPRLHLPAATRSAARVPSQLNPGGRTKTRKTEGVALAKIAVEKMARIFDGRNMTAGARRASAASRLLRATCCYILLHVCLQPSLCGSFLNSGCISSPRARNQHRRGGRRQRATMMSSPAEARTGQRTREQREPPRLLENLKIGDRLKGVVVSELEGKSGKKAWVSVGVMRRAKGGKFSHVDGMIRLSKEKGLKPKKVSVDKPVTVYVSKVIEAEGRLEVSLRAPKPLPPIVDTSNLTPLATLQLGDELSGVVKTVTQFAAFVECGVGRPTKRLRRDGKPMVMEPVDGFLGKEDIPEDAALSEQLVKAQDQTNIISEGDRITVFVKEIFPSNGRFHVTLIPDVSEADVRRMKNATKRKKSRFAKRLDAKDLPVGKEMWGGIVRVYDFGYFVDVGAKSNGLVHISSISEKENRYLGSLEEFARVGDKLCVRVNGVDEEGRLSLAYEAREQDRPKPPNRRQRRRAERGVEGNTVNESDVDINDEEDGEGGFLFEAAPSGSLDDDDDGVFDIFEDM